jgi:ADP-ribosyl-[dinitrogen reductase] hydrolase
LLIELAIGDAYGAGFEYADRELIRRRNDLSAYVKHPKHRIIPGAYTDDTQMSLAIVEAILADDPWTPEVLARHFVEVFKRDPREGYARGFFGFLQKVEDGAQFLKEIEPTSDKSGAAMRAAPIGIYPAISMVIKRSALQAALTHNTPDGINAAITSSLMTHYFLYELGPKKDLGQFLEQQVRGQWAAPWVGAVKSKGWMSVRAAITAIHQSDSLSKLLKMCIDFSGDVDTVATIALAAGSCCGEITHDLPDPLFEGLENGSYGRDYLCTLDDQLKTLWEKYRLAGNNPSGS